MAVFIYKKYDTLPPGVQETHSLGAPPSSYENKPNWIDIYDALNTSIKVRLNSNVNNLAAGNHSATIRLLSQNYNEEDAVFVELSLEDTVLLSVSPTSLNFAFTVGGSVPAAKSFSISSETSWTITKNASWLSLSVASGSNNGSCLVSVNPTGLAPGVYNDNIAVNDGTTTKNVAVSFTVSDTASGSDFLNVYPTNLSYGYTQGGSIPTSKSISLNASDNYTVSASETWVSLSATSGASGNSSLIIGVQNIAAFAEGNYEAFVDITVNSVIKRVNVNLAVYPFVEEVPVSGDLHFADDNNIIQLSSGRFDTHLQIDMNTNFESKNYSLTHLLPYFNGAAEKRIGEEAKKIIAERTPISLTPTRALTTYNPLNFTINIKEVELYSNTVTAQSELQNLYFIKGKSPVGNKLSYVPNITFLTKKGVLILTALSNGNSVGSIVLSGAVNATIPSFASDALYYTAVVNLADHPTLIEGDEVTVQFLDQNVKVVIVPEINEQTILLAENEWGFFEVFEFTGEFADSFSYKSETYTFRKDHLNLEERVFETRNIQTFKVNTGFIRSAAQTIFLKNLLNSNNMYLINDGEQYKVNFKNSTIVVKETNRESVSFDLIFENVLQ